MARAHNRPTHQERRLNNLLTQIVQHNYNHPVLFQACAELGLPHEQLLPRPIEEFQQEPSNAGTQELRYHHYEARRKAKLTLVADYLLQTNQSLAGNSRASPEPAACSVFDLEARHEKVQQRLKDLDKQAQHRRRKLQTKLSAPPRALTEEELEVIEQRKCKAEARDEKIRNIARDKRRQTEERERSALKQPPPSPRQNQTERPSLLKQTLRYSIE